MRQVVLDTETTGLEPERGHRIIEIGCVELVNRRPSGATWHRYLRPQRSIDDAAIEVHGLTDEFLADKPLFAEIADEFLEFVKDSELVIHNAPFDVGFINSELARLQAHDPLESLCEILDTLSMARSKHPGQKNSLDALCKRYHVDNSRRELHGALLDAQILAEVYLAMTGGQAALSLDGESDDSSGAQGQIRRVDAKSLNLVVLHASAEELEAHEKRLAAINEKSGGSCLWLKSDP